jgi:hypothetical protein
VTAVELEPQDREELWLELRNADAAEEVREEALREVSILLGRLEQAPRKDGGPLTEHRDQAAAMLCDLIAARDRVRGAGRRARGRFYFQVGKGFVQTDRLDFGKKRFREDLKMYIRAARAALKIAQKRVSKGRQPAHPDLSAFVTQAAFIWQKFTGQEFMATNLKSSKKPIKGAQIRFMDLMLKAADVTDLKAASRGHLMKQALKAIS